MNCGIECRMLIVFINATKNIDSVLCCLLLGGRHGRVHLRAFIFFFKWHLSLGRKSKCKEGWREKNKEEVSKLGLFVSKCAVVDFVSGFQHVGLEVLKMKKKEREKCGFKKIGKINY